MPDIYSFGAWVRRRRRALDLTQTELAGRVGCTESMLRKIELDARRPSKQVAERLAAALELPDEERVAFMQAARGALAVDNLRVATRPSLAVSAAICSQTNSLASTGSIQVPIPSTPLIGREVELAELSRLLCEPTYRLVTILGPGGMGKTRLAVAVTGAAQDHYHDGVYYVALASLRAGESFAHSIARVVQLPVQPDGRPITQQVLEYLGQKQVLLVLDNFEHLLPDGVSLVSELLQACPRLCLLVTSRERLQLSGEIVFTLRSLPYPTWETPRDAERYGAVQLFVETARRVQLDFQLTADNLQLVARICRLVGGMPLGIILAATWADVLTVNDIAAELLGGFDFLSAELRDLPDRQRSMRAVITSSWQRLAEAERAGFAKLSVFQGGFTRRAAEHIAGVSLTTLTRLVHASFVQRAGERFELHALLRQYGDEQLHALGWQEQVRAAHSRFFLECVREREEELAGAAQGNALAALRVEFENIRFAWHWAVQQHDYASIDTALNGVFLWFWLDRGQQEHGLALLQAARQSWESDVGASAERLQARIAARIVPVEGPWLKDGDAAAVLDRIGAALEHARLRGDTGEVAFCLWGMGLATLSQVLDVPRQVGFQRAVEYYTQSLQYYREHEEGGWAAQVLENLGHCYRMMGQYEEAIVTLRDSLARRRDAGDRFGMVRCARELGFAAYLQGASDATEGAWNEAYAIAQELGDAYGVMDSLFFLSILALTRGEWANARLMIEHVAGMAERANSGLYERWCVRGREIVAAMEQREGERGCSFPCRHSRFTAQFFFVLFGRDLSKEIELGLRVATTDTEYAALLLFAARLLEQQRARALATQLFGLAHRYPDIAASWIWRLPEILELQAALATALGSESFQREWEAGRSLVLEKGTEIVRAAITPRPGGPTETGDAR